MSFSVSALINAFVGGLVGSALTWLIGRSFQKRMLEITKSLGRLVVMAARNPNAVDITFDEQDQPHIKFFMNAEAGSYHVGGKDAETG